MGVLVHKMNKKMMIIISVLVLLLAITGFIFAKDKVDKVDKILKLKEKEIEVLSEYGITNPTLSSCVNKDNYTCESKLYEDGGINKGFVVEYNYCNDYEWINESEECIFNNETNEIECFIIGGEYNYSNCLNWKVLDEKKIEDELEKQLKEFIKWIVKSKDDEDLFENEGLTDEFNIIFEEE